MIHIFLARELTPVAMRPQTDEVLEARWVPFAEALSLTQTGRLRDGKSIVGLIWAGARHRASAAQRGPEIP